MMIDRSPGPLAQRLWSDMVTQLSQHAGCCPVHIGTRLICAWCDVAYTGSIEDKQEIEALAERSLAAQGVTCRAWPCGRCGTQDIALCVDCDEPAREQAFAGLTPEEEARLLALCERSMRYTFEPPHEERNTL